VCLSFAGAKVLPFFELTSGKLTFFARKITLRFQFPEKQETKNAIFLP
jgi:hypothetical protein